MIAHICDQCGGDVGNLLYTATPKGDTTRHFCAIICLSAWATTNNHRPAAAPEPEQAPKATNTGRGRGARAFTPEEDARILSRFRAGEPAIVLAADYDVARPTIYAAIKRARAADPLAQVDDTAAPASETRPKPEPAQVNSAVAVDDSEPPARPVVHRGSESKPRKPPITARCSDCGRTWNLTGRVLRSAVQLHEHQRDGHVVDILTEEAADA